MCATERRSRRFTVAKQFLASGFLNEVVDRLDHPAITEHIHELIEAKFARR